MKNALGFMLLALIFACHGQGDKSLAQAWATGDETSGHELISQGDVLKIRYHRSADFVQFKMFEGLTQTLAKNPSGIFEGQLEIPDLDDGIFSYDIIVRQTDSAGSTREVVYKPGEEDRFRWIGKNRKIAYRKIDELAGKIDRVDLTSHSLGTERALTIYTPAAVSAETPILYLTDGSVVEAYAPYVDALISQERIMPVKLVGIHSSRENRYEEYVYHGTQNSHFENHENFFISEVLPFAEDGIEQWRGKRYVYGFSNGAAFCMYLGLNHPDRFEAVIAFSTADYISEFLKPIRIEDRKYPTFYMGVGRYEKSIFRDNVRFVDKMKRHSLSVEFKTFVSGHDYFVWQIEFLEYLEREFSE